MAILTRANLSNALILALLGFVVVESTAVASQRTTKPGTPVAQTFTSSVPAKNVRRAYLQNREIVVLRKGGPAIVFTDDRAIAFHLSLTRAEIERIEAALAKDLEHGEFRARETRRAVGASKDQAAPSTAGDLVAVRRELSRLKEALRRDLAKGDFRARHTRREVTRHDQARSVTGDSVVANGVVSVSDDIWDLEMAVEKDLHTGDFRAIETHFAIDGRRWKVH
jgi:hypothetical protein